MSPTTGLFLEGTKITPVGAVSEPEWTMYLSKLKKNMLFESYEGAQAKIELLTSGFYQIEKIFKI